MKQSDLKFNRKTEKDTTRLYSKYSENDQQLLWKVENFTFLLGGQG